MFLGSRGTIGLLFLISACTLLGKVGWASISHDAKARFFYGSTIDIETKLKRLTELLEGTDCPSFEELSFSGGGRWGRDFQSLSNGEVRELLVFIEQAHSQLPHRRQYMGLVRGGGDANGIALRRGIQDSYRVLACVGDLRSQMIALNSFEFVPNSPSVGYYMATGHRHFREEMLGLWRRLAERQIAVTVEMFSSPQPEEDEEVETGTVSVVPGASLGIGPMVESSRGDPTFEKRSWTLGSDVGQGLNRLQVFGYRRDLFPGFAYGAYKGRTGGVLNPGVLLLLAWPGRTESDSGENENSPASVLYRVLRLADIQFGKIQGGLALHEGDHRSFLSVDLAVQFLLRHLVYGTTLDPALAQDDVLEVNLSQLLLRLLPYVIQRETKLFLVDEILTGDIQRNESRSKVPGRKIEFTDSWKDLVEAAQTAVHSFAAAKNPATLGLICGSYLE